jgi:ribosomal protein S18 acetylase RimI-like enzyme
MADIMDLSKLAFIKLPSKKLGSGSDILLNSIKQVEKRSFPSNEAFDFNTELPKRTTNLYCAFAKTGNEPELCGYIVYVRSKLVTRIHKVCVVEKKRGQGIGRWMMDHVLVDLKKGGAGIVDLWVDKNREIARKLYEACGFEKRETVENYYSGGRDAVRMEINLCDC